MMDGPAVTDTERKPAKRGKLAVAGAVVLLLLLAVLLPPYININRYQRSIAGVISRSLGRPVHMSGVGLRLLPTPGIVISDFEVEEEPAFGAEPVLRASSVVASLRLSSLWRGRLEVSRISLDEASLNLVRNAKGLWNIGSVLDQASHLSNAPTMQRRAGSSPRFPYIEASNARINFREGLEKKPFSLMNAEFSMWLDTPDQWRLRLTAQPVRTDLDLHLSDTGELQIDGSLQRAADINAMPLHLDAEWSGAQLGQASRLLMARDTGWRGDLDLSATLTGDVNDLHVNSRVRIGNVHRQEFQPGSTVDVDARCTGDYQRTAHALHGLTCFWPVGNGHLLLTGDMHGEENPDSSLRLEIDHLPASFAVDMIGLMRQRAGNAVTTGTVSGDFEYSGGDEESLTGQAVVNGASLRYAGLSEPMQLPAMHFIATPSGQQSPAGQQSHARAGSRRRLQRTALKFEPAILLQSFSVAMGGQAPLNVSGRFTCTQFALQLSGQASLNRLLPLSSNFGLMQSSLASISDQERGGAAAGIAGLSLSVEAPWVVPVSDQDHPELAITTTGSVELKNIRIRTSFLPDPLQIPSATLTLEPGAVVWNNASAVFHGIPVHGSVSFQTSCAAAGTGPCPIGFSLETNTLDAAALQSALLGAGAHGELLDAILAHVGSQHHMWPVLNGSVRVAALEIGDMALHNVAASVSIADTNVHIASLDAEAFGGTMHAVGSLNAGTPRPVWKLDVQLTGVHGAEASSLFHERWGAGTLNADVQFTALGFTEDNLTSSATGDFHFDWRNGTLPTAGTTALPLPHFDHWTGEGTIGNSRLTLTRSQLSHGSRSATILGTVTFARQVDLNAVAPSGTFRLTGSMAHPAVNSTQSQ
ncbi:AsmA family protein [Paracidobacterium acidisoli]|uniref:AsmA family protein n=1 Tax=Paracidobacterium acidisoli TaxID=2303751 RepID=A0A372IPF0_9BACT|nr:AsmA family protein [Paracidobacterium acidisoli]MBT9332122.1 AsmA family protein [Paracidobacterium acidisoli]